MRRTDCEETEKEGGSRSSCRHDVVCAYYSGSVGENPYVDVPQGAWYYDAVEYVATEGLFAGTGPDTFSPNASMTRAMFVTVLGKFAQVDPTAYGDSVFQDVSPEA